MALSSHLSTLQSAGLISLAGEITNDLEYVFQHTLFQEAAYDSLLKSERQRLHLSVGQVLEELLDGGHEELAARLGEHFWQAGDQERALRYFLRAAENAAKVYANSEAITNYSQALKASEGDPACKADILLKRGKLYELQGKFESARQDLETALAFSREVGDLKAEWRCLVNLGLLWAAHDYRKAGEYYQQALDQARQGGDEHILGHSLNRMGNWFTNTEKPDQALQHHHEALEIFTRLDDDSGNAETYDLLGMANLLGGNLVEGKASLRQAVKYFSKTGDRHGLVGAVSTLSDITLTYLTETLLPPYRPIQASLTFGQKALEFYQQTGRRSDEAYTLCGLILCYLALGEYDRGLEAVQKGLEIAGQIQHRQWEIYIHVVAGALYLDICAYARAEKHLEHSLALARQNYSLHWMHCNISTLATVHLAEGRLEEAAQLLETAPADMPSQTVGQRWVWSARAELALAQGDCDQALEITQRLLDSTLNLEAGRVPVMVGWLRGCSLLMKAIAMGKAADQPELQEAEQVLTQVIREAKRFGYKSRLWRVMLALSRCYALQGRHSAAWQAYRHTQALVSELAGRIADPGLRRQFLSRAMKRHQYG